MHNPDSTALFYFAFSKKNQPQIKSKARLFRLEPDEVNHELFILIADRLVDFDPSKGSAEAFFLGILHARLTRARRDVSALAESLDNESENGVAFRASVEYFIATRNDTWCFTNTECKCKVLGASDLESLADAASGQSASELARKLGISRRRVNQILRKKELDARTQMGFRFGDSHASGEEK